MEYREHTPRPALASVVDRLWTLSGDASEIAESDQFVLPDGRSELLLHVADPMRQLCRGQAVPQPRVAFAGQLEGPLSLRSAGRVAILGVRFHSDGAAALLRAPQQSLTGAILPVDAIDARLGRALAEVASRASAGVDGVAALQDLLERAADPGRIDVRIRFTVRQLRRTHGRASIEAIGATTGVTRRHLERRFQELVGMAPRRLARIIRFQHARRLLETLGHRQRGTITASSCGYADQAHFIRDFRELSGQPPEAYLGREDALTRFFVDDDALAERLRPK